MVEKTRQDTKRYDAIRNNMIWYDMIWYDMIWYDIVRYDMIYDLIYDMIFFNWNWVPTRWQSCTTHSHTSNTQNVTKQKIHRTTQIFWKSAGRALSLLVLPWHLHYNRVKGRENHQRNFLLLLEKNSEILTILQRVPY